MRASPRARSPSASAIRPARSTMSLKTSTICCSSSRPGCSTSSPAGSPRPMLPGRPGDRLRRLVGTYFVFTQERPKLWNLLNEHRMPAGREVPEWYQVKVENLLMPLEAALAPLLPDSDPVAQKRHARTLWASVHGMTALSTADKLSHVTGACRTLAGRRFDLHLSRRSAAAQPGAGDAPVARRRRQASLLSRRLGDLWRRRQRACRGRNRRAARRRGELPVDRHSEQVSRGSRRCCSDAHIGRDVMPS